MREESPLGLGIDRDIIVYDYVAPAVVLPVEKPDVVPPPGRLHVALEHALNRPLVLCEACNRREQPTVAELALADVAGRDAVCEEQRILRAVDGALMALIIVLRGLLTRRTLLGREGTEGKRDEVGCADPLEARKARWRDVMPYEVMWKCMNLR